MTDALSSLRQHWQAGIDRLDRARRDVRQIRAAARQLLSDERLDYARILTDLAKWRLMSGRKDFDYRPEGIALDKLCSARDAIAAIRPGDTVVSSGFAATGRCSIFFSALREVFEQTGGPGGLTWITVSAQGGRGKLDGTIEELALPGLLQRYICGHLETAQALLQLADDGKLEIHTLPQGEMTFLLEAQANGRDAVVSSTGIGTFLDPRCGSGTAVTPHTSDSFISVSKGRLRYTLPKINVAMLSASHADEKGNLYFDGAPTMSENIEVARAARRNGGKVLAVVGAIAAADGKRIGLAARDVDCIVVDPHHEQIAGVLQDDSWAMFTPDGGADLDASLHLVRYLNTILGATARRSGLDAALARMAGAVFARHVPLEALVNIGIGMPEEVCWLLYESGLYRDITLSTESGVYGGIPLSGIFFGAAANPEFIGSSAAMFRRYRRELDATVLGFLQVDSFGNVNVSRRGKRMVDFVGPGGFCNIADSASTIIFVGSWMVGGSLSLERGKLQIGRPGMAKFVHQVNQVTFNGQRALRAGKTVFYVTNVGVFELSTGGLTLRSVAPGVDIQRDILDFSSARIIVGDDIERVPSAQMTGHRFKLHWNV